MVELHIARSVLRWKTGHKVSSVLLFHKCFEPCGSVEDATPERKIYHQSGEKFLGALLKRTRSRFACSIIPILTVNF